MWNAVPNGGYALDPEERIEQARLEGEYQGMADQAVWEAIEETRLRKKERA
jgi:hypothetical protein